MRRTLIDNANTGPTAQEELCADYPDNIACPTLPAPPQLEDGTDFSEWEPSQCPAGAMPDFGKPGCIVIGDPCPEGDWPEDLPTDNIRYVTPGGTGDGRTKETAAGSIQAMLSATTSGTTIALSKGRFEEHFEIARRQHVVGACARDTVIAGLDASRQQVVGITGTGGSSLRNLSVTGNTYGVLIFNASESVQITGILIDGAAKAGLLVSNGELQASFVSVRSTQASGNGSFGRGIELNQRAQVVLKEAEILACREVGILISQTDTRATLEKVRVDGTESQVSSRTRGRGILVSEGASLELKYGLISQNRTQGLLVRDSETSVSMEDVVIQGTRAQESDGSGGRGVEVHSGAELTLTRALVKESRDLGVVVGDSGTLAEATDLSIMHTGSRIVDGLGGRGLNIQAGASFEGLRLKLQSNRETGLFVSDASATLSDVSIINTLPQEEEANGGRGIQISDGAVVGLERSLVRENRDAGIIASGFNTTANLADILVEDTLSSANLGDGGRGLEVGDGAAVNVRDSVLRYNREVGVMLTGEATTLILDSVAVSHTDVAECARDPDLVCPFEEAQGFGDGILVLGGAQLQLQDFELTENARVGLYLYDTEGSGFDEVKAITGAPVLDILRGTITGNPYGINFRQGNITPSDFLGKEVACYDNAATVDGCYSEVELEVPNPSEALEGLTR